MAPVKEIYFPIFLECCKFCDEPMWEGIFEDMACGKAPLGTFFNMTKGLLCCNTKGSDFSYKIENKSPEVVYNEIYSLLKNKLFIQSKKENQQLLFAYYETERKRMESYTKWSDIRKKTTKNFLLESFVLKLKQKYLLSEKETHKLLEDITTAMTFKAITPKDIIYSKDSQEIEEIKGITEKSGKPVVANIYGSGASSESKTVVKQNKKDPKDIWRKYIETLSR